MQRTTAWCTKNFETWAPDLLLFERARQGDGQALGVLASRHWSTVYCVAWNMLADIEAASQVAEATFLSILRSDQAFPVGVPFTTSLYRVVLGESWRRLRAPQPEQAKRPAGRTPEMLQRLDSLDRAAFILRELEELSANEAAEVLGIAPASIRERTHRATLLLAGGLSSVPAAQG
jgi:RNA polymerase sigma-70 factor (ECF subfamily)